MHVVSESSDRMKLYLFSRFIRKFSLQSEGSDIDSENMENEMGVNLYDLFHL